MSTHHEEALEELKDLPGEIQRSMALIGQLDRESYGQLPTIKAKQQEYIRNVRKRLQTKPRAPGVDLRALSEDPGALEEIKRLKSGVIQKAKEKIAVAQQAESLIEDYIRRLDARIHAVKAEVDASGEPEMDPEEDQYDLAASHGAAGMGSASAMGMDVRVRGYDQSKGGAASGGGHGGYGGGGGYGRGDTGVTISGAGADAGMLQADAVVSSTEYCICNGRGVGDMVGCDYVGPSGENCEIGGGWFHMGCVGIREAPKDDEKWYCEHHRAIMEEEARGGRRKKRRSTRG